MHDDPISTQAAIVTGGAQGIGLCTAATLIERGWSVTIVDVDGDAGAEAIERFGGEGRLFFVEGSVGDEAVIEQAVSETVDCFGGIAGLVNNAGIGRGGPMAELSLDAWHEVINVNLTATFQFTRKCAPYMTEAGGAVVNIASTRALMSEPNGEAYAASKGGIVALTHASAVSLGPAVRVNAICPGWIDTRPWHKSSQHERTPYHPKHHAQHPAGRIGKPEDIANLAAFLLSDEAGFITGQHFVVDGGMTRKMIYLED